MSERYFMITIFYGLCYLSSVLWRILPFFYRLNLIFLNEKFWRVGDHNKVLECCKVDNFKGSFLIETKAKLKKYKFSQGDPMYVLLMKSYWIPIYIMGGLLWCAYMLNWKSVSSLGSHFSLIIKSHEIPPSRSLDSPKSVLMKSRTMILILSCFLLLGS